MRLREMLVISLLPALSGLFPEASAEDLKFFGSEADICSPLPAKYGLDTDRDTVYNMVNGTTILGRPMLRSAALSFGYLNFTLTEQALELLADEAIIHGQPFIPDERIETGSGLYSVRSRLRDIAAVSDGAFYEPIGRVMRSAFLHCLLADSPASLSIALSEADEAIRIHRIAKACGEGELLSGKAALAMAACLYGRPHEQNTLIYRSDDQ